MKIKTAQERSNILCFYKKVRDQAQRDRLALELACMELSEMTYEDEETGEQTPLYGTTWRSVRTLLYKRLNQFYKVLEHDVKKPKISPEWRVKIVGE